MNQRPTLGITQRYRPGRNGSSLSVDAAYVDAVRDAGAEPLLLPHGREAEATLARLDGLLIPGGPDFVPDEGYDDVAFEPVASLQLAADTVALETSRQRAVPVLGICYGMQLLALYEGGALHPHLPLDLPSSFAHTEPERDVRHDLEILEGTRLAGILGAGPTEVNSRHHQAVSDSGSLRVAARAGDGVIEAIEARGELLVVGVQWHPERMDDVHRRALFGAFADACRFG
jgi:putative glutamine amidotransferase